MLGKREVPHLVARLSQRLGSCQRPHRKRHLLYEDLHGIVQRQHLPDLPRHLQA